MNKLLFWRKIRAQQGVAHSTGNPERLFSIPTFELNVPVAIAWLGSRRVNFALDCRILENKE